jgi:hypothetical protein
VLPKGTLANQVRDGDIRGFCDNMTHEWTTEVHSLPLVAYIQTGQCLIRAATGWNP